MSKVNLMKKGLPLMLAFSLLAASATAVPAANTDFSQSEEQVQTEEASYKSDKEINTPAEGEPDEEKPDLQEQTEEKEDLDSYLNPTSDPAQEEISEEQPEDPFEGDEKDFEEEITDHPLDTPYEEILREKNLIIVTVDSGNSQPAQAMTVETVEELSEPEIQALEEYIEEQGYAVTANAMLAASPASEVRTITFNMNGFLSLAAEGYGTGYDAMFYVHTANYQGNGNAYCIDPSKQAPGHDSQGQQISYTTTVTDYNDSMLLKIMYYGFGGPGDITESFASTGPARHILTHLVATKRSAELGVPGAGTYTYGANTTAISMADALYEAIKAKPEIIGTVSILTPVQGQQTLMLLANYSVPKKKMTIRLKKASSDPAISDNNSCYSLKGAVYGVYSDSSLKNRVGTFETKADGSSATSLTVDVGTYYIKEITAPKGYLIDDTTYKVSGKADQTITVKTKDAPASDQIRLLLQKKDQTTGKENKRLKGAQFTVNYYAAETAGAIPERTWVLETDEKGEIYLSDSYKVSGDAFFTGSAGEIVLPLGILTIQETKAPEGYYKNDTLYFCPIKLQEDGRILTENLPTGEAAVEEIPIRTSLSISKTVSGSGGNKNTDFHFELTLTSSEGIELPETVSCLLQEINQTDLEMNLEKQSGEGMEVEGDSSVYTFTLHHGQKLTLKDLPIGLAYKVEETDGTSLGYQVTAENETGNLEEKAVNVAFSNRKEMIIPTGSDTNVYGMGGILITGLLSCLLILLLLSGRRKR